MTIQRFFNWWQHIPEYITPNLVKIGSFELRYYALMYLLAFVSVGLDSFIENLKIRPFDSIQILFIVFYGLLLICIFKSLFNGIKILQNENFKIVDVSNDLISFFKKVRYEKAIQRLAYDYLRCISDNEKILKRKNENMENNRESIYNIMILTIVTTILYIIVLIR